ncbi:MAG TPA: hypothetical protein GXZ45_13665 [Propionibacterium sp.]|nr:hypothetical protein [Propionibacterium sp.]
MPSRPPDAPTAPHRVDAVLDEFYALRTPSGDPVLDAIATAIFVEDAFGVTLSDAEIDPAHLAGRDAVRHLLTRHLA